MSTECAEKLDSDDSWECLTAQSSSSPTCDSGSESGSHGSGSEGLNEEVVSQTPVDCNRECKCGIDRRSVHTQTLLDDDKLNEGLYEEILSSGKGIRGISCRFDLGVAHSFGN